ncbi:hypothetical protein EDB19DRAFT_1826389 [Suillus lakei]|nr:hypothetical protein EDB19DRAFT_1826389 [Suillus lakei]
MQILGIKLETIPTYWILLVVVSQELKASVMRNASKNNLNGKTVCWCGGKSGNAMRKGMFLACGLVGPNSVCKSMGMSLPSLLDKAPEFVFVNPGSQARKRVPQLDRSHELDCAARIHPKRPKELRKVAPGIGWSDKDGVQTKKFKYDPAGKLRSWSALAQSSSRMRESECVQEDLEGSEKDRSYHNLKLKDVDVPEQVICVASYNWPHARVALGLRSMTQQNTQSQGVTYNCPTISFNSTSTHKGAGQRAGIQEGSSNNTPLAGSSPPPPYTSHMSYQPTTDIVVVVYRQSPAERFWKAFGVAVLIWFLIYIN